MIHQRQAARFLLAFGFLGAAASVARANITINIVAGSGLASNTAALAAFNRAAAQWAARITDPVTVTVNADLGTFSNNNIIGSTSSVFLQASYTTIRNAMVADAADENDDAIVASLPTSTSFTAILPTGYTLSSNMLFTKANAKALGFTGLDTSFGASDGTITFNQNFSFDYDNSNGVGANQEDFETVAAHEIGHLLGFVSAVDTVDTSTSGAIRMNPLDLFRFQNDVAGRDPATAAQFATYARYLVPGGDAITDDITNEYRMSTGVSKGDGNQASHWKADDITGVNIGIMDPTLAFGQVTRVGDADFRALDLIGYDIQTSAAAPEPASLALALPLLGLVGIRLRHRVNRS